MTISEAQKVVEDFRDLLDGAKYDMLNQALEFRVNHKYRFNIVNSNYEPSFGVIFETKDAGDTIRFLSELKRNYYKSYESRSLVLEAK